LAIDDKPHEGADGKPVRMLPAAREKVIAMILTDATIPNAAQRKRAQGQRGAGDDGRTIAGVVRGIAKPNAKPKELWPLMFDALAQWCGDEPKLGTDANGEPFYEYELVREGKETINKRLTMKRFKELLRI